MSVPRYLRFTRALIIAVGGPAATSALLVQACSSSSTPKPAEVQTDSAVAAEDDTGATGFDLGTGELTAWSDAPFDTPVDGTPCNADITHKCTRTCRCPNEDALDPEFEVAPDAPTCTSWGEAQWNACYAIPGGPLLPPDLPRRPTTKGGASRRAKSRRGASRAKSRRGASRAKSRRGFAQ